MITISEAVESVIKSSAYLEEGISLGIINLSSLARVIKPEIEEKTMKEVTVAAVMMSLKRFSTTFTSKQNNSKIFKTTPDMIVRSNLIEYTVANSGSLFQIHKKILDKMEENKYFLVITQGVFETTIIVSSELKSKIEEYFSKEKVKVCIENLSAITIRLPQETVETPAVYYLIHKLLVWEGINVVEAASTYSEFTLILKDKDVDKAFSVLKRGLSA
ncbi:MAG: aspartate kinase [Patescibacteria group bacterium]